MYAYVWDVNAWVDPLGLARKPTKNRLPEGSRTGIFGPPNGILVQRNSQTGEMLQIRTYDSKGNPVKDIDFGHDHGFGDPHVHDWTYPSKEAPNKVRGAGRSAEIDDLNLIDDVKNGKVNYH